MRRSGAPLAWLSMLMMVIGEVNSCMIGGSRVCKFLYRMCTPYTAETVHTTLPN